MFIWESAFLGLEPGKVVLKNNFSSYLGGVGSPAWITDDNYKGQERKWYSIFKDKCKPIKHG
jgi:hypothetical protein